MVLVTFTAAYFIATIQITLSLPALDTMETIAFVAPNCASSITMTGASVLVHA